MYDAQVLYPYNVMWAEKYVLCVHSVVHVLCKVRSKIGLAETGCRAHSKDAGNGLSIWPMYVVLYNAVAQIATSLGLCGRATINEELVCFRGHCE